MLYEYHDYKSILEDTEDLYEDDYYDDIEEDDTQEWDNYYHSITKELVDE